MYEGVFPEYIEMVSPPVKVSEYVKSFSYIYGLHLVFQASIKVSFLIEVCQSPVKNKLIVQLWVSYISVSC